MTRSITELADLIGPHLVTDDTLRYQPEPFTHTLWLRYLPDELTHRYDITTWPTHTTRQDLLDQAHHIHDPASALALYLRIAGFGATTGQTAWRRSRPLTDPRLSQALLAARTILLETGPLEAYQSMMPSGPHYIYGLGPALASTWLYYCGYPRHPNHETQHRPHPLTLDTPIAHTLHLRTIDTRDAYPTYLHLAHTLADHLHTTPHCITHALAHRNV